MTDKSKPARGLSRRELLKSAGAAALASSSAFGANTTGAAADEALVYVGTYSDSIHIYFLNYASGALRPAGVVKGVVNPSYLTIDARRRAVYAVNEINEVDRDAVTAFVVGRETGGLRKLNEQPSQGTAPCHISVDPSGKFVLVANYGSGTVGVLPIADNGSLGAAVDVVQHRGSGGNPDRQAGPHAHCVVFDRSGRYVFAVDLGIDKVMIYRFDPRNGKLAPNSQPFFQTKPGAGPRHLDFHSSGRFAYLIHELDSTVTTLAYDAAAGRLQELQTISTLPAGFEGTSFAADVHVHPSGRFVYGSNRGHDSIVAFAVDEATGKLSVLAHEPTRGSFPRNFAIDPTGRILIAANQRGNTLAVFRIDRETGKLSAVGEPVEVPKPACVKFAG